MFFCLEISNSLEDQQFILDAEDVVSAMMQGIEFAKKVDERLKARLSIEERSVIIMVAKMNLIPASDAGIEEYIDSVAECVE